MELGKLRSEIVKNKEIELQLQRDLAFQVGRQLEKARLTAKLTQQALAEKIGTHQSSIARAESGLNLPSLSFLKKIADAVGAYITPPQFVFMSDTRLKTLGVMRLERDEITTRQFVSFDGQPIKYEPSARTLTITSSK